MRFYPLFLAVVGMCVTASALHARIGESRAAMEARLLHERRAALMPDKMLKARLASTRVPYINLLSYLPADSIEHAIFFKKSKNAQVSRSDFEQKHLPDGWELHVVFYNGISVFEAYRRVGSKITDAELNGLLVLNQGQGHWQQLTDKQKKESGDVFGAGFVLSDESMKAALPKDNGMLLLYRPQFELVIRQKHEEKLLGIKEEQEFNSRDSLYGF